MTNRRLDQPFRDIKTQRLQMPSLEIDVQKSPKNLKENFRPKVESWGFNSTRSQLLSKVQDNWLAGEEGVGLDLFRQENHKNMTDLEWLQSQGFINSTGTRYYPKFLGFSILLVLGNTRAVKLRETMDEVVRTLKSYMKVRPLKLQRKLAELELALKLDEHKKLLIPALQLIQDKGGGVSLSAHSPNAESDVSFTDWLYKWKSTTSEVWSFLGGYPYTPQSSFGLNPISIPFDLNRLKIAPDAHANATKAIARLLDHPDSAVSSAKAAVEATFKHILGESPPGATLPKLAGEVRDALGFDKQFLALGRSVTSMALAVNDIRNAYSDAHGKHASDRGPTRAEAQLTVGSALLLCDFLLDRWEATLSTNH